MASTDLNFADRGALVDFLVDGRLKDVAKYLKRNQKAVGRFLKTMTGNDVSNEDLNTLRNSIRRGDDAYLTPFRELVSGAPDNALGLLPLKSKPSLWKRSAGVGSWLTSATAVVGIVTLPFLIDNNDITPDTPPNNGGELSEQFNEETGFDFSGMDAARQDALRPFETVDGLYQDTDGTIYYQDWIVPNDVFEANVLTAQIAGMPLSYSFAVQALESSLNPNAFNGIRACGLSQFVPSTLAEMGYRFSPLIGYEGIRGNLIERTRIDLGTKDANGDPHFQLNYDYADEGGRHTMINTCWDPHFNTRLAAVMQIREIGSLQREFAEFAPEGMSYYPVTELQGYVAHFAGGRAGENIIRDDIANDGASFARDFFSNEAINNSTNQWLLFHTKPVLDENGDPTFTNDGEPIVTPDTNNPRTVAEFLAHLEEEKGLGETPLPNFTNWSAIAGNIEYHIGQLNLENVTIVKSHAPAYSPRPILRPTNNG